MDQSPPSTDDGTEPAPGLTLPLGSSPLFAALDPQAQHELLAQMVETRLPRGDTQPLAIH